MASTGFNQTGGAYYLIVASVGSQTNTYTPGTGSGGATTAGSFSLVTSNADLNAVFDAGKLLKDMGKTVVSSGRTFRKFQPVVATVAGAASFGVSGAAPAYFSTYLEIGREGQNGTTALPRIARFA